MWEQTRGKWGAEATKLVCSLATTSETKEIINRSKSNGAPGLDGVQSSALKLVILACEKGGGDEAGGPDAAITFLTNLLNTILLSPVLPATLSRAELVYFYKKGDPLDLQNYRGIALQSVLYKMAASHTARRIQEASSTLSLLHPSQEAARKGSHAGVQAANIVTLISHARAKGLELHLTFCDIAKALDSVPQRAFSRQCCTTALPLTLSGAWKYSRRAMRPSLARPMARATSRPPSQWAASKAAP
jgi:hypothetical protein